MYKLIGHSLQRGAWFEPESQPMTLIERNSNSSITLGPDAPEIGFNDWLLDDGWPEGPTVWRVKGIDNQTDTETVTVSLEHVIRTLEDPKLFEDVETGDIAGGETCTSRQAIEYLLARQNDWVLGDCEGAVSLPYEFSGGDSLLDAIESVSDTIEDAEWWYDLSRYPFVLNIRKRNGTAMCEMRGGRNVSTLRRSINRSGMYTRIWPVGKNDLHVSGDYISRNENIYGRIDKVETNEGKTSEDSLRAWANGLLRKHCEPTVTITISGLEMSQETGESLDWIQLNRVCRCPLPEFNTTILERVIKITWRDRKKDPEAVTVTLGNSTADVRDLTKTVEETSKRSGSGARGQAKQNYLFEANGEHLLYEVFDECGHLHGILRMTEQSLRVAFENLNECTRSEFYMTSESLRVQFENEINSTRSEFQMTSESLRVTFENEIASTRSQMEMTSESLRTQFENEISSTRSEFQQTSESLRVSFQNEISSTRSEFQQTSESMRVSFQNEINSTRSEFQMTAASLRVEFNNEASSLRSAIQAEAGRIGLLVEGYGNNAEIKRASIVLAINNGTSSAHIDADEVYIGNQKSTTVINGKCVLSDVTADYIAGKIATIPTLSGITANFSGNITSSGALSGYQVYADSRNISNPVMYVSLTGPTNNVYTLVATKADGSYNEMSFSRAVSSWTMGWSGGKFTAKANPQDQSCFTTISQGTTSWDGNTATIPINATDSDNPNYSYATGRNITVDASSIYSAGETAGYNGCHLSGSWGSGSESNKLIIGKTTSGSANSLAYVITAAASISYNSSTNKFVATGKAKVDGTEKDNASDSSGEISIAFNSLQGSGGSAYRTVSVKNGSTAIRTSGNLTDYGDGYTAGYNAGWNAACAKVTRSGNKIYGPVTGKATASSGQTEVKFTANYTASSHSYTPSSYSASSYTKESHSYKASSHSFSQAICKTNGTNHTKYWYNSNFTGSVEYHPATDSYTASSHSYTASKYTASSYTAESHSYTASSFSWS